MKHSVSKPIAAPSTTLTDPTEWNFMDLLNDDDKDDCQITTPPPPTKKVKMANLKRELRLMAARLHEIIDELDDE